MVQLDEANDAVLKAMLNAALPGPAEQMNVLLLDQRMALMTKHPEQRRWGMAVISLCLNMYVCSPRMYADLKESEMLVLPCGRLHCRYKNCIKGLESIEKLCRPSGCTVPQLTLNCQAMVGLEAWSMTR